MIKHLNSKKLTMRVLHVHCLIQILSVAAMKPLHGDHNENNRLSFSADWDTLGPFQIGTREATWGADPLEYLGGFRSLRYNSSTWYHSSLAPNGKVSWSAIVADVSESNSSSAVAVLMIDFPAVDWEWLRSIYGWAAFQYQAWTRGNLVVDGDSAQTIAFYTDNVLEFWIDDQIYFGGDFYAYRKAPLILYLDPGPHRIDVRLIRDVRVMGGNGKPSIRVSLEAQKSNRGLAFAGKPIVPDIVDMRLASNLGSISVRNEERSWIDIWEVQSGDAAFAVKLIHPAPIRLAPGQSRPLAVDLRMLKAAASTLSFKVLFTLRGSSSTPSSISLSHRLLLRTISSPHKVTYLLPCGIVSYSILRAPLRNALVGSSSNQELPVLLNLHGADLEADSHQVRHMLDSVPNIRAWTIFPTGVTPWSGDDWHIWGFADVEASVAAISDWIKTFEWEGVSVKVDKWLISGHSNGGQGAWYALTHHPDKVLGGAPVSGYPSIQAYVPYTFWRNLEPRAASLLQSSLADYQQELLIENLAGIPVQQQHGSADDNVSAYHSRRMSELISQTGWFSNYAELNGQGHWFDGVMTTIPLCKFYDRILQGRASKPDLPQNFTFRIANPANMASRGGIVVDQLDFSGQIANMEIDRDSTLTAWTVRTSNILRFHLLPAHRNSISPMSLMIDGHVIKSPSELQLAETWLVRSPTGSWQVSHDPSWQSISQRYGKQLGALDSILSTQGRFTIVAPCDEDLIVPMQVSRNLFQYFGADTEIFKQSDPPDQQTGNIISIFKGDKISPSVLSTYPIRIKRGQGLCIENVAGEQRCYKFEEGIGAVLLRPLPDERLELVLWGYDDSGLHQAARLLPMITGVGQPEYIIVSRKCAWKGAGGVLAMGSFDSVWDISETSFAQ